MTKTEITTIISRRLGDASGTAFTDRSWEYFEQELYNILAKGEGFSGDEIGELRGNVREDYIADLNGRIIVPLSIMPDLYQIERIFIEGYPAKEIGEDEYYQAINNPIMFVSDNEYRYMRSQNELLVLTNRPLLLCRFTFYYYKTIPTTATSRDLNLGRHIIFLAVDKAVQALKLELGMTL